MRKLTSFIGACLLVFVSACSKPQEIKGQVFVVTKGGVNFKLGSVEVLALTEDEFKLHVDSRRKLVTAKKVGLKSELDTAEADLEKCVAEKKQIDEKISKLEQDYPGVGDIANFEDSQPTANQVNARVEYNKLIEEQEGKSKQALEKMKLAADKRDAYNLFAVEPIYFTELPKTAAKAVTDAEGSFQFNLTPGKYVLLAKGNRQVMDNIESYYWAVKLEIPRSSVGSLVLSNNNMTDSQSPDSYPLPK